MVRSLSRRHRAIPTPQTVTRNPYVGDTVDGLGNATPTYGTPEQVSVYSIVPRTTNQETTWATAEDAELDVYMPKTTVDMKDRFVIDGDTFTVAAATDWTRGFTGWQSGIVVELKRVPVG